MVCEKIAIVGMSCRLPDAPTVDAFWDNVLAGRESIRPLSEKELTNAGTDPELFSGSDYVNAGTMIEGADQFDAAFFGISPREALLMDPQHRLFLQEARILLDRANLTGDTQQIGVFAACRQSTYQSMLDPIEPQEITRADTFQQLLGNDKDYLATRVAYRLDLDGPAMSVQTACSSSLVAIHQACESLRRGEADAAIAGGVGISFPQGVGYYKQPGMIFSVDGQCRPFSADGNGIVAGNGLGVVALKRLPDARAAGDVIHAVITGSAVSNDGAQKVGFTAPSAKGQMRTIRRALDQSGTDPNEIGLIEAHATGTPLGDPIEIAALDAIYKEAGVPRGQCGIGSVKGNVGHLDTAAGVASLIKAACAVRYGQLPPTLHAAPVNPDIGFEATAFYPIHETTDWPAQFERRIAAVSSFGIGGTNCHIVIEEAPEVSLETPASDEVQVFAMSAPDADGLRHQIASASAAINQANAATICRTAALCRAHFPFRAAVIGTTGAELCTKLALASSSGAADPSRLAFVFSGQGSQQSGMGVKLACQNTAFRNTFEGALTSFASAGLPELRQVMTDPDRADDLNRTLYTQPALYAFQIAYCAMLKDWDVLPDLVFGHSIGEFAALVTAGVLTDQEAIGLVAARARLMEEHTAPGRMLALWIDAEQLTDLLVLHPEISVAAYNGPDRVAVSGEIKALDALKADLDGRNIAAQVLPVNRAFHSATMDQILTPFGKVAAGITPQDRQCDILSSLTGESLEAEDLSSDYWCKHLRAPVQFDACVQQIPAQTISQVIEIGPDGSFARLIRSGGRLPSELQIVEGGQSELAAVVASLYTAGHDGPLRQYYQARPGPRAELPPLSLSPLQYWPEQRQDMRKTKGIRDLVALEALAGILPERVAVAVTLDRPLPLSESFSIQSRHDGAMARSDILVQGASSLHQIAVTSQRASPALPEAPLTPVSDLIAKVAPLAVSTAWLGAHWTQARTGVLHDNTLFLETRGQCVARIDLVRQPQTPPVRLWSWGWERVETPGQNLAEPLIVLGDGALARRIKEAADSQGQAVSDQISDVSSGSVLDCRLAELSTAFTDSTAMLSAAHDLAVAWQTWSANGIDVRVTMVLPQASEPPEQKTPAPIPPSPTWAVQALWRFLRNEQPGFQTTAVSLTEHDAPLLVQHAASLPAMGAALQLRGDRIWRPVLTEADARKDIQPLDWSGMTLVAGFGAVGRALTLWLAEQGARDLALVMHRCPDDTQQATLDSLRAWGVAVHLLNADLTDVDALTAGVEALPKPVSRAFHTAHAGTGGLLHDADSSGFEEALRVKTTGALALWEALHGQPLDVLCLFSSAAPTLSLPVPAPGVGYAAANAWQDAFAASLQAEGAPVMSIAWGQWEMTRDPGQAGQHDLAFVQPIPAETGFALLNALLKTGQSGQTPIIYDETRLRDVTASLPATAAVMNGLMAGTGALLPQEPQLPATGTVAEVLRELIATRLKIAPETLDPVRPLTEQGVDSLIFLEIVQIINRQFDLSLAPTAGYDHRTLAALASHIEGLGTRQDIDFSYLLESGGTTILPDAASAHDPFPLTDLQQAFWLGRGDGLKMGGVSCHEYVELEFDDLDVCRLQAAWNRLIARHDMMRCTITPDGQQQILRDVPTYQVVEQDLRDLAPSQRTSVLEDTRHRMTYQVFAPDKWPLFELRVSHLPEGKQRLHLDMDLLVFDIQSFRVIYGELGILLADPEAALPDLTLSFRDYILAERGQEASESWQQAQRYWQDRLDTFHPAPDLPLLRDPGTLDQPQFRCLTHRLPPEVWRMFQARAAEFGLTPSAVLLAAYTHALSAYAKAPDFTLNVTYFNRKNVHPQVMDICGDFTSLMLLPVSARAGGSFLDACKTTQEDLWQALKHRDYNGIRVMRDLGRKAGSGVEAVQMPVVFTSMIGMDFDDPDQPGWELRRRQIYEVNQTPQVWLDYQATEYGGALMTRWFVADDLFDSDMINGLFDCYTKLIERLTSQPETWDAVLPDLRGQADRDAMEQLHRLDNTKRPELMGDLRIVPEGDAARSPAILTTSGALSHAELDARVNRLAHLLVARGVAPAQPVGVVSPKSQDAVIAALAIQAAGACYVPLNPAYPEARLRQVLAELKPAVIFAPDNFDLTVDYPVIDPGRIDFPGSKSTRPAPRVRADQRAYIIYTSGTTGTPKGVMLDHSAPINTLHQLNKLLGAGPSDRTLSMCAFHHDMSVFDVFGMLYCGGAVILPEGPRALDPVHWLDMMETHRPTILNAVPAFIAMLLEAQAQRGTVPPAPRHIMMGGDWIPVELVQRIHALWPNCTVHSIGGPTETAIVSAHYQIEPEDLQQARIPYGRPLPNQTCLLLNDAGQICPVGVVGEICMGGMARSIGYWNDPEGMQDKYRVPPLTGETLFHTGDLGLLRHDGQLEILGRKDNQLKINGQRVEAADIETALEALPHIEQAVVIYDGAPVKQLQGFVTLLPDHHETSEQTAQQWDATMDTGKAVVGVLPDGIDLDAYAAQYAQLEHYSTLVMLRTLQRGGVFQTPGMTATKAELVTTLAVSEGSAKLFESWLGVLVADGYLHTNGDTLTAQPKVSETADLDALTAEIDQRTANAAPHEQRIWSLILRCGEKATELLTGDFNPLELMFEGGETDFVESWYRENPVSEHFNRLAGRIAGRFLQERPGPLRILEFGAGIGSVTHDIVKNIQLTDFEYYFTDLSTYFLDQAAVTFADVPQMRFGLFNINDEPGLQGYAPGSFDLIIGANVLHDASDANAASRQLRGLLKSDGAMLLIEGTTNPRFQMISLGFVEGLTHYADERLETCLPMLSADRWQRLLRRAGFGGTAVFPPENHPVEAMNYHVILGQNDGTDHALDVAATGKLLAQTLPTHMVPVRWHPLLSFPLTANGKVDRSRLTPVTQAPAQEAATIPLSTTTQQTLAALWQEVLRTPVSQADANFFVAGGDSLLMTRLGSRIDTQFGVHLDLATLLRHPVLNAQADLLEAALLVQGPDADADFETGVI